MSSQVKSESSSGDEEEQSFSINTTVKRRVGRLYNPKELKQTRHDKIREVNMQILPLTRVIFAYTFMFSITFWLAVIIVPAIYVKDCQQGHYFSAHIIIGVITLAGAIFEFYVSRRIVQIIQPLSGHPKLSPMQLLRLGVGPVGRFDMYTDMCFLHIAFKCDSIYAPFSATVLGVACGVLIFFQIKSALKYRVLYLQLAEFLTIFDLLGKYELMYVEGEKTYEHKQRWAKKGGLLPTIKFFCEDIGQFTIQLLFLIEQGTLNTQVLISLILSLFFSFLSVLGVYLKVKLFQPNFTAEQEFLEKVTGLILANDMEQIKETLNKESYRKWDHDTRAEILRIAAINNLEIFTYIVDEVVAKNDAILQSDIFHSRLVSGLRHCKDYPDSLIKAFDHLKYKKNIYLDVNKRISISTEGTILHCLMNDPFFILRTLKTRNIDMIKFLCSLGADVNLSDKFGETPPTLVARLNLETIIRSCSTLTLKELIVYNNLKDMAQDEFDEALKSWAYVVVEYFIVQGADLKHKNKKNRDVLEISEAAGNEELSRHLYDYFGLDPRRVSIAASKHRLYNNA